MGLDPPFEDYEAGVQCGTCKDVIFNGVTPKYVDVLLLDVFQCAGMPVRPPNGTYQLTQRTPCTWGLLVGNWDIQYWLNPPNSIFRIVDLPFFAFFASVAVICLKEFTNELLVCNATNRGTGGTASIFWGPTIGP